MAPATRIEQRPGSVEPAGTEVVPTAFVPTAFVPTVSGWSTTRADTVGTARRSAALAMTAAVLVASTGVVVAAAPVLTGAWAYCLLLVAAALVCGCVAVGAWSRWLRTARVRHATGLQPAQHVVRRNPATIDQ